MRSLGPSVTWLASPSAIRSATLRQAAERPLELAHARFARVTADDGQDRFVGNDQLLGRQAGVFAATGEQKTLRDLEFFLVAVASEADQLHPVQQGPRNGLGRVGGGDEEDSRQVERQIEIVVAKRRVLGRVEDFQECGGRIAPIVAAELVDFIQHQQRILDLGAAEGLQHAARHSADVRAAMAAQLRLVVQAAETKSLELAAQRAADRLAQRGFADARRADEAEDRRVSLGIEFHHRQMFEDSLLDVGEAVMVLVEHVAGGGQVEVVGRHLAPGQLDHQFEMGPRDLKIGRDRGGRLEPLQLALSLLSDLLGELDLVEPLAKLHDLRLLGTVFAEFFVDGAELLAEQVFALLLAHFARRLLVDLLSHLGDLLLADEFVVQEMHGLEPRRSIQDADGFFGFDADHRCQQVDNLPRVFELGGQFGEVDPRLGSGKVLDSGRQLEQLALEGFRLGARISWQRCGPHRGRGMRARKVKPNQLDPFESLDEGLDDAVGATHAADDGLGAKMRKVLEFGLFDIRIPLSEDSDQFFLALRGSLQRRQRLGPSGGQRHQRKREKDRVFQRQERQSRGVGHVVDSQKLVLTRGCDLSWRHGTLTAAAP